METIEQQLANDLATAYTKRAFEQIAFKGYIMALESNGIPVTETRLQPYADALNEATKRMWKLLWTAYEQHIILHAPGRYPVLKYNANTRCTASCKNARGFDCECSCFGAGHGANHLQLFRQVA